MKQLNFKSRIRKWLGIEDEMTDVWFVIRSLQESSAEEQKPEAGVVSAKRGAEYWKPHQEGNVIIAEPKEIAILENMK